VRSQDGDGDVEVLDVKRQVVTPDVAVAWGCRRSVLSVVLEHLEHRLPAEAEEVQLTHLRGLRDPEALTDRRGRAERTETIEVLAARARRRRSDVLRRGSGP
jgi:hypothetical protein